MINLSRRIGGFARPLAAWLAAGLACASLAAGAAWASASSSVKVTGPRTVQTDQRVKLHFTGYAAAGVHQLKVWLDDRACAASAQAEGARSGPLAPSHFRVHGQFRARLTVEHSSRGTHVVCAYLVSSATHRTAARGSWRYVTG